MYNAPAKYNVKGALLNVVLSKNESETPSWQGETVWITPNIAMRGEMRM